MTHRRPTKWFAFGFGAFVYVVALLFSTQVGGQTTQRKLAITVDDLPGFGPLSPATRTAANARLLAALTDRSLHATGFVVCANAASQDPVLQAWIANGMELGNHTDRHRDLHTTSPEEWPAGVEQCHARLSQMTGKSARYFRYPMLHQGTTTEQRNAANAVLSRLGYTIAHVTADNSDYLLAQAYDRALRMNDAQQRDRIARDYMEHMLGSVRHFDAVGEAEFGRRLPQVLLLHANTLAADHLGSLLDALKAEGIQIVPLSEVLTDPFFAVEDTYTGPRGLSWFYRVRPGAFDRWGTWDDSESARILATYLNNGQ